MPILIAMLISWIVRKLGLLLLILAVLLVGGLRAELDENDSAIAADTVQWRQQAAIAAQALTSELDALNARIASAEEMPLPWQV